jgi:predicted AlkP superfamily pyrophosphatase or phosphodiesterase
MRYKILFVLILTILTALLSSCGGGSNKKSNILLITIDTLRRDHLGAYGYHRETSPFMDRLAREGMIFKHAVTPIPSTAASHTSILTGLHPLTHQVTSNADPLSDKVRSIAEIMKQNGYYTMGTVAVVFLSSKYNFSKGFDSFSDHWEETPEKSTSFERFAPAVNESLFKQIEAFLASPEDKNKPLFIWVHYYDPHWPYRDIPGISFKAPPPENKHAKYIDRYDKEIRYTDRHIEALHRLLEEKGLAGHLLTCITADHGEEFGEHENANGHADFYSEDTFVPLILHGRGIPANKTVEKYVSTMDIPVTLLKAANLAFDGPTEGMDLLDIARDPGAQKERKLLVIGNARYTRSLQLLGYPFSYILNFDHHYKHWFLSHDENIAIPGNRFKPIAGKYIKKKRNTLVIPMPRRMNKGLNYGVWRVNVTDNKGFTVQVKMLPYSFTQKVKVAPGEKKLTVIYPAVIRDRVFVNIEPQPGTVIDTSSVTFAFISKEELPADIASMRKLENKIFEKLATRRKKKDKDEMFDLAQDVEMMNDLVDVEKLKPQMVEYKKLIYAAYKYFYQKGDQLLKGKTRKETLSAEEKKMLKSLGYL